MIYNPTSITRCLSSQAYYFDRVYGQMFFFTDQSQLWYDTQDNNRVLANDVTILQFERQRNNYVPNLILDYPTEPGYEMPNVLYSTYSWVYVIETNSLYRYQSGIWTTVYGKYGTQMVAQTYMPDGNPVIVVADDVTTNGILNDGSVIVRDNNKMICGWLQSDGYTFNIKSLIGGCIILDPSGSTNGSGCLQLDSCLQVNQTPSASLNGNLVVFGDIKQTSITNWNRQYRLAVEDIIITVESTIKQGSTLEAGSVLGSTTYTNKTILDSDVIADTGTIKQGSKIYKDSIVNGNLLQPPYLFDTENIEQKYSPKCLSLSSDKVSIDDTTLVLDSELLFENDGDTVFIPVSASLSAITKVRSSVGNEYDVEYVATSGINNSARVTYYAINNKIKILP